MDGPPLISQRTFDRDIAEVLIPRDRIAARVDALAGEIAGRYGGEDLTVLAVLTGSLVFLADLLRRLPLRVRIELVRLRSYRGADAAGGPVEVVGQLDRGALVGRDVLVVDDILDSGRTLARLGDLLADAHCRSVRTCVLLRKRRDDLPARRDADFVGFDVADRFVVGYGLDFDDMYRNLPDICLLADEPRRGRP